MASKPDVPSTTVSVADLKSGSAEQLYRWHWRARLPERRGELFRVLVRGRLNACMIEFLSDGWRVITSRNALRRA